MNLTSGSFQISYIFTPRGVCCALGNVKCIRNVSVTFSVSVPHHDPALQPYKQFLGNLTLEMMP